MSDLLDAVRASTIGWAVPYLLGAITLVAGSALRKQRSLRQDVGDIKVLLGGQPADPERFIPERPGLVAVVEDLSRTIRTNGLPAVRAKLDEHDERLDHHERRITALES